MRKILFLFILTTVFSSCGNRNASSEVEAARLETERLKAEADSLKVLLEEKGHETDGNGDQLPSKQIREVGKLNPVDEGVLEPDFVKFRNEWIAALERKDVDFILKHVDPEIKCSFDVENGKEEFKRIWFEDKPNSSEFWTIMKNIMALGGTFDNKDHTTFLAPYVFTTFPDAYDAFTHAAITGEGVRLRESPSRNAKHIKSLSYDIVQWFGAGDKLETIGGETFPWVKVRTLDSLDGYVFGKYIHSPIGFRAGFEKTPSGWQMFFFLAGD